MISVLLALAYQASYASAIADCVIDTRDTLALCAGALPGWLTPITLTAGVILTLVATWRLRAIA
jgi:hypothetical protein